MKKPGNGTGNAPVKAPAAGEAGPQEALARLPEAPGPGAGRAGPKPVAQVLGGIAWLMRQSPRHKALTLGDLEWLVMPAILLRQFRIFYQGDRPVGVALWALA